MFDELIRDHLEIHYRYTITSANDSGHSINSLHYKNKAIDVRIKDIDTKLYHNKKILESCVCGLGYLFGDFVFILHLYDGRNHLHIQHGRDNIISFDSSIGENNNVFIK
jgi:hypothetical protein